MSIKKAILIIVIIAALVGLGFAVYYYYYTNNLTEASYYQKPVVITVSSEQTEAEKQLEKLLNSNEDVALSPVDILNSGYFEPFDYTME